MLSPHLAYMFPPPLAYYAYPSPSLTLYVNAVLSVCCDKAGVVLMKIGGNALVATKSRRVATLVYPHLGSDCK